jgi:hypothetical protein
MTTDIDKLIDNDPELQEAMMQLAESMLPFILSELFLQGKIDENRIDDLKYVWSVVMQNIDIVENLRGSNRIDEQLLESAKDAAQVDRIPVVVILVATAIEHRLNMFYREALENYSGLSSDESTEAIKSNATTKLGWLLHLVSGYKISDELLKKIRIILDLRNAFVHYKSIRVTLNETDKAEALISQVHTIGVDTILNTPDELESELAFLILALLPAYEKANQLAKAMIKMRSKNLSKA